MNDSTQPNPAEHEGAAATPETVRLDHFLKIASAVATGGQAKLLIQSGDVTVNSEVETRRRRKLVPGDRVIAQGEEYIVETDD
ncbi:RNA-binding S4 domain-containing protein [Stratiformator vulcanicus]|uniref:Ribosome-associated protein n=1 Tax=Stratiformator vulcanicus TaxID=2527980 RepID=A0A517QYH2_9PLAN|nr:RNA-binding S4 domain-containing protein [Stratiformator vulcanicus]QDT36709.1 ribosome-associated protein [Stratiformator vulcanicus]